jgi:hypothetical protein
VCGGSCGCVGWFVGERREEKKKTVLELRVKPRENNGGLVNNSP